MAIAAGTALSSTISLIINIALNKKLLKYTYTEQFKDLFPSFIISLGSGAIVFLLLYYL